VILFTFGFAARGFLRDANPKHFSSTGCLVEEKLDPWLFEREQATDSICFPLNLFSDILLFVVQTRVISLADSFQLRG
jgi:hypothetical protein